jgi:hypothetical protein
MHDFQNDELIAHLLRLVNDMNDSNSWEDPNHYAALSAALSDTRHEILRRMRSGR